MSRKNGLEIKKAILQKLKQKDCSLRELETKVNTNYLTIRNHVKELEYFKLIETQQIPTNKRNGRPYTLVKITLQGRNF